MDTAFMGLTSSRDVTVSGTLSARVSTRPIIFASAWFADGADREKAWQRITAAQPR
ncbi:hypothetical protein [Nocardia sp. CA-135398]|uniref:hypothetical protein n=1 Tax=Nocardia sp. CA-135398 TaxID=3239977 RepID=UPI003D951A9C